MHKSIYFAKKSYCKKFLAYLGAVFILNSFPISAVTMTLGFEEALILADSINPEIKIGYSRIKELELKHRQITSNYLPQIDASISYSRFMETPPGKKYLLGDSRNDIYTDLTARQLLFDGGKYHYQAVSNNSQLDVEEQKLELVRRAIHIAVSKAWFEALRARYSINIQQDLIKRMQDQQEISELLYASGKVSNLDILRLKTQILSAQGQLQTLRSVFAVRLFALAQSIGTTDMIAIPDSITAIVDSFPASSLIKRSVDSTFEYAPEIKATEAIYEKTLVDQRILKADFMPSLWARGGINIEDNTILSRNSNWNAGVVLNVPIFKGGSVKAQNAQAQQRTFQASQSVHNAKISYTARVNSAFTAAVEKQQRIGIAEQTYAMADETNDVAELKYSSGKLSAFELIDAQNTLARAQQEIFNARIDYRIALEELSILCKNVTDDKERNK